MYIKISLDQQDLLESAYGILPENLRLRHFKKPSHDTFELASFIEYVWYKGITRCSVVLKDRYACNYYGPILVYVRSQRI